MKTLKGLEEIHRIIEEIYDEEKDLTPEERIKRLRDEAERFLTERKLKLTRTRPRGRKDIAV